MLLGCRSPRSRAAVAEPANAAASTFHTNRMTSGSHVGPDVTHTSVRRARSSSSGENGGRTDEGHGGKSAIFHSI
jgi:hypothetical protein